MSFIRLIRISLLFLILSGVYAHGAEKLPPPVKNLDWGKQQPVTANRMMPAAQTPGYFWRGLLIGGDHGAGDIHHDNIYVRVDDGPIIYQTTIPARKSGNLLPDAGLLWHFYTRDETVITVYATSAFVSGVESDLSDPFPLYFSYPVPSTCTEQTVPVSAVGEDQFVTVGTQVTLDGSQSFDAYAPDNVDLVYRWECYSAPESSVFLSDEGNTAAITFTPNQAGNYYFRFNVRDTLNDTSFNRSPVSYVRVSAVGDTASFISANAGRTQQVEVGQTITLDGSQSRSSNTINSYTWTLENPLGLRDIQNISDILGTRGCQGECYLSNFDADDDVDGSDLALLAANYSGADLPDQQIVQFVSGIARPHIFKLTIDDSVQTDSETTIVAVHHENANPLLTPPVVEESCLE